MSQFYNNLIEASRSSHAIYNSLKNNIMVAVLGGNEEMGNPDLINYVNIFPADEKSLCIDILEGKSTRPCGVTFANVREAIAHISKIKYYLAIVSKTIEEY